MRILAAGSFRAFAHAHLEDLRRRGLSLKAQGHAVTVLPRLFAHLREEAVRHPRQVTHAHLARFARTLRELSPATRTAYLAAVRRFFVFLERQGIILMDPSCEIHVPPARRLPRAAPSQADFSRLVAATAAAPRDQAVLELLYGTGLRVGECARLDLVDVDLAGGTLLVRDGKGRKDRLVPLTGRALAAVDRYLQDARPCAPHADGALFLTQYGRRLQLQSIEKLLRKHAAAAGLGRVTPHHLRHACATHLLQGGADIRHVQALLGHKDLRTTELYTHVDIGDLRGVIERAHPRSLLNHARVE